jgi:hypothetical protein
MRGFLAIGPSPGFIFGTLDNHHGFESGTSSSASLWKAGEGSNLELRLLWGRPKSGTEEEALHL